MDVFVERKAVLQAALDGQVLKHSVVPQAGSPVLPILGLLTIGVVEAVLRLMGSRAKACLSYTNGR